jgi:AcrR family transcriptional regulator
MTQRSSRPPPSSLRERGKRKTLAAIRDAAWSLFTEQGFDRATTRAIAERAQVAAGTVFAHAKNKDELLVLTFQQRLSAAFERSFERAEHDDERPLAERLASAFDVFFDEYATQPELALRYLCTTLTLEGPHAAAQRAVEDHILTKLESLLERARANHECREDLDASGYALNLFAIYRFTVLRWLSSEARRDAAIAKRALLAAFSIAHVGARPRAKKRPSIAAEPEPARRASIAATPTRPGEGSRRKTLAPPRVPQDLLPGGRSASERPSRRG